MQWKYSLEFLSLFFFFSNIPKLGVTDERRNLKPACNGVNSLENEIIKSFFLDEIQSFLYRYEQLCIHRVYSQQNWYCFLSILFGIFVW